MRAGQATDSASVLPRPLAPKSKSSTKHAQISPEQADLRMFRCKFRPRPPRRHPAVISPRPRPIPPPLSHRPPPRPRFQSPALIPKSSDPFSARWKVGHRRLLRLASPALDETCRSLAHRAAIRQGGQRADGWRRRGQSAMPVRCPLSSCRRVWGFRGAEFAKVPVLLPCSPCMIEESSKGCPAHSSSRCSSRRGSQEDRLIRTLQNPSGGGSSNVGRAVSRRFAHHPSWGSKAPQAGSMPRHLIGRGDGACA